MKNAVESSTITLPLNATLYAIYNDSNDSVVFDGTTVSSGAQVYPRTTYDSVKYQKFYTNQNASVHGTGRGSFRVILGE